MPETRVRVAHTRFGAGAAPISLAEEHGLFVRHGLGVDRRELDRPGDIAAAVVARDVDLALCGGTSILGAAAAGGDPVMLRSIEGSNRYGIIGARGVTSPDELRGQAVGVVGPGEVDHLIARRALRGWGLDPERDVTTRACGSRGGAWEALLAGEVLAMASAAPQPFLARRLGLPVLRDFAQAPEPFQMGGIVTSRRFADARPDVVRAFLAAIQDAVDLFRADVDAALPHLQARTKLDDLDVLRETYQLFCDALADGVPTEASLRGVADEVADWTGTPVTVDLGALLDPSYLPPGRTPR